MIPFDPAPFVMLAVVLGAWALCAVLAALGAMSPFGIVLVLFLLALALVIGSWVPAAIAGALVAFVVLGNRGDI